MPSALQSAFVIGAQADIAWELVFEEDGTSLTNWTQVSGSWTVSDGLRVDTTGGGYGRLKFNTAVDDVMGTVWALEAELKMEADSVGSDAPFGPLVYWSGSGSGAPTGQLFKAGGGAGTKQIRGEFDAVSSLLGAFTPSPTWAFDAWHKLTLVGVGAQIEISLDDNLVGFFHATNLGFTAPRYVGFVVNNCKAHVRNVKLWHLPIQDAAAAITIGAGGVSFYSPLDEPPGTPDAFDDEFDDSTSLSDWTAFGTGTLATEDVDTTVPGRLYLAMTAGADSNPTGRYKAISTTGTYLVKIGATSGRENYHRCGCVYILPAGAITGSSPCLILGWVYAGSLNVELDRHSALATYQDQPFQGGVWGRLPALYARIAFASATSVTVDYSPDGIVWARAVTAYNPGWNMDKIGYGVSKENGGSTGFEVTFDYFRKIA